ncbi:MAG: hypothetical protein LH679_24215 [Cyanobacteria bacterium CAN_BIN43]|nr:hypothetical protein [Cyanobacteria bacterium CAN_BIN43]
MLDDLNSYKVSQLVVGKIFILKQAPAFLLNSKGCLFFYLLDALSHQYIAAK